ncbi:MAG: hypothetical protein JWP97_3994 [Labilithrix sp.]|nr:hypothetical protein [Labilithrix sp.]
MKPSNQKAAVRGAIFAEYTLLVGTVALVTVAAFIGLGVALVSSFEARRDLVLYPFP